MVVREIRNNIYSVGVVDWNRREFDALIPLPDGTSYNSFIVRGSEKIALIDTVDSAFEEEFVSNIAALIRKGLDGIDYIVVNHAEQDHSGALPMILELFPMATIVTTEKCRVLLEKLLSVPDGKFKIVTDGETLSLGDKTLEFIHAPWVHWPETMLTFEREDGILFTCDFLGSHYATSDLFVSDERALYAPAKRYYAEIMMPFRTQIQKHLERLSEFDIQMIAPSHGPFYDRPEMILDLYREWVSDDVQNRVLIPYISMHGSTGAMVKHLSDQLIARGIDVLPFDISGGDMGRLAMGLVDCATIVIATPTVLFGPHPKVAYAAFLANALKPKARVATVIGSYGWGGKAVSDIVAMIHNLKAELLDPVYVKGYPDESAMADLGKLADQILEKHREFGIAE